MFHALHFGRVVPVFENHGENHGHHERVPCEDEPRIGPPVCVHDGARGIRAEEGAETVGHNHKDALRRGADLAAGLLFDEERAGDVEEVECHAVDDHRKHEERRTRSRIADAEEPEAQHPGQHRNQHHFLNAETPEEERNQQNAERFGHLRQREQDHRVLHDGRIGILGHRSEVLNVAVAEGVGDLQSGAQQHREDEENGHPLLLEEREGPQAQRIDPRLLLRAALDGTPRQRERVGRQYERQQGRNVELPLGELDLHAPDVRQVDEPHGGDESHGSPYADGREMLHGIEPGQIEGIVGHGVRQGDGRHVEHHAQQHAAVQRGVSRLRGRGDEKRAADEMADAQQFLRRNPAVGDNPHHGGHEQRGDSHRREEAADLQSREVESASQVGAQRDKPRTPDRILKEVHGDKPKFNSHNFLILCKF